MTYRGIARGKTIELGEPLPYSEGQPVDVSVEPLAGRPRPGSSAAIQQVVYEPPHLRWEDVDELERAIEKAKLPVHQGSVFDEER